MDSQKTPLFECHVAAGARIVDFAGWQMPIQYADGIIEEHLWTRTHAGLFDVSHMGRIIFKGPQTVEFLQYVLTSDVSTLPVGKSQYCIIPTETGGAVDDAYLYRFVEDEYFLVVNASNKDKDIAHFNKHITKYPGVTMNDVSDSLAMIALQGPESEEILGGIVGQENLPAAGRNNLAIVNICGKEIPVGRTGYTGEPICFELMVPEDVACDVWNLLLEKGAKPIGLGARDTLRLEAGLPLYGHEFGAFPDGSEMPAFSCPLAKFAVSFADTKGDYIGKSELEKQPGAIAKTIKQIVLTGKGIARDGAKIIFNNKEAGYVTSGTMVPCYVFENGEPTNERGQRAVGLAMLDKEIKVGDKIMVDVRGRKIDAMVVTKNADNRTCNYCLPVTI